MFDWVEWWHEEGEKKESADIRFSVMGKGGGESMSFTETVKEIVSKEGYASAEEFARDGAVVLALSRVEQYKAEIEYFEKKYGMNFEEFESFVHRQKGREDFAKEADAEDWEFALEALRWWQVKVGELQDA